MPNRCGIMHLRGTPSSTEVSFKGRDSVGDRIQGERYLGLSLSPLRSAQNVTFNQNLAGSENIFYIFRGISNINRIELRVKSAIKYTIIKQFSLNLFNPSTPGIVYIIIKGTGSLQIYYYCLALFLSYLALFYCIKVYFTSRLLIIQGLNS